jgi:hypothetical protein
MSPVQSILLMLIIVALAFAPGIIIRSLRKDRSEPLSSLLPAREAAARHLYGEAVGWSGEAMEDYDHSPLLQREWLREADLRLRQRSWA